jgi:hypothetical protein
VNVPGNPAVQAVGAGWGIAGGVGYNFDRRNGVIGEVGLDFAFVTAVILGLEKVRGRHRDRQESDNSHRSFAHSRFS